MEQELIALQQEAEVAVAEAPDLEKLNELKVKYLGKKGLLTGALRNMGSLPAEERPRLGQVVNRVRDVLEQSFAAREVELKLVAQTQRLAAEQIDVTLPGRIFSKGHQHPLTKVQEEIEQIFMGMGFSIAEGPEIESDYYNFEALNIPKDHPARDMQDSFYITEEILLRTHTSPVQVRTMEKIYPTLPVKIICPGKVFRKDDDATHSPMFNQVEGLVVDKGISMADLKGILLEFARQMFGPERQIRLRPSFFPFTEPSAEVDVSCMLCGGEGCRICKGSGWVEILGSGMVHPQVLRAGGYNPDELTGFAFGMGIERIAMLKYNIDDMRHLYDNDLRFLRQF
ncbi:MAG TPA: phenylalanine--tRNA ligase subunit alpha [Verrucomicrobiae bacterium]|nr:phenylalanine--tRNA ligase subunit alpha [Verrucomicrobiae bacterium]